MRLQPPDHVRARRRGRPDARHRGLQRRLVAQQPDPVHLHDRRHLRIRPVSLLLLYDVHRLQVSHSCRLRCLSRAALY